MIMGKVVGVVVSTQKDTGLTGYKLLIVQNVDLDIKAKPAYLVTVDAVGAGIDELVIVVQGSSARLTKQTEGKPVDACIIAIVDSVEIGGKYVYEKFANQEKKAVEA